MNYLAHAFLSGNDEDLILGNFIADHLKGNLLQQLPSGVAEGVMLHRRIDTFTDNHPLFRESKRIFYKGFERHSGILVDIYFDHLLASNFERFSLEGLDSFAERIYSIYRKHAQFIPVSGTRFLDYLTKNKIYQSYATEEGIETVLFHLSQRIRHGVRLDESLTLFQNSKQELSSHFFEFSKDLLTEFPLK